MKRWALQPQLASKNALLASLSFKSHVAPVPILGGTKNGKTRLNAFVSERLGHYGVARNHPDEDGSSGLSPYLHFGHLSPQHVLASVINHELQTTTLLPPTEDEPGTSSLPLHSSSAVNFVDQLITWRELGFNFCAHRPDYAALSSLPAWALATIKAHASDVRPITYSLAQFESAETHDAIWNPPQRQLLKDGVMHNYLRMLWGKKIYEWSTSAAEALETMIHLNNKYALDGRDPNSYSGIFWTLGRYDRAWGPERPIFGKLRYMTSDSTRKKLRLRRYLERYGPGLSLFSGCAVFWMQFLGGLASG